MLNVLWGRREGEIDVVHKKVIPHCIHFFITFLNSLQKKMLSVFGESGARVSKFIQKRNFLVTF